MCGAVPPLAHVPSWTAWRELYIVREYKDNASSVKVGFQVTLLHNVCTRWTFVIFPLWLAVEIRSGFGDTGTAIGAT